MKILHLISSGGQFGAENVLLELSTALKQLGCDLIVAVFENKKSHNIEVYRLAKQRGLGAQLIPCAGKFDGEAIRQLERCIRENEIDVLHSHGYKSNIYGYWVARKMRIAKVATCHGWPGNSFALRSYYLLDKIVLQGFDRVIAVSEPTAAILRRAAIPTHKIRLISNGVDAARFHEFEGSSKIANRSSRRKSIGVVARLSPEKGIHFLLKAAKDVLRYFPDTNFCLIGDGPERGHLESLARELGIEGNVEFWGLQKDMPSVYAQLDIFVLPSLTEGLPMAILEAMAAAKPVIATRVGAIPNLVIPEKTGLLVEPADSAGLREAILQYLRNPATGSEHGKNGAEYVRRCYSSTDMAQKYLHIYHEALNQRRPGTAQAQQEA
jgi:glycosyltransferase involved in cell wall biosynthesis